jgi:LuxR family transcriptional regulator, maltose regulon positive regulatory protein
MSLSRPSTPRSRLRVVPPGGQERGLAAARAAMESRALEEAIGHYRAVLAEGESAEALEGLGTALLWTSDARESTAARERAFALYREAGDARSAARVAIALAVACTAALGEDALALGWIERARALLAGLEPGPEHAWLALWDGHLTYFLRGDLATTRERVREGLELARRLGLAEAELFGLGLQGVTRVAEGRIEDGLRDLKQAATGAVSGEIQELTANGNACCYLLSACEQVLAYDQAAQWTERIVDRSADRVPASRSFCRAHWAAVLMWRGEWEEAERELVAMERELARAAPVAALDVAGRLGELRRRQGRYDEAEALFARAGGNRFALVGRAALALERGDPEEALRLVDRSFRKLPPEQRLLRVPGHVVQARAAAALGRAELARTAVAALREVATASGGEGLAATARLAEGYALLLEDEQEACAAFEDAADLFEEAGAPWEAACARLEAAELALRSGRSDAARAEASAALDACRTLGAAAEAARAERLLDRLAAGSGEPSASDALASRLSARQLEVLALVAKGLSNREIGARLGVSELTVKRHVADLLTRLDVPTRAAAAALAAQHGVV